MIVWWSFGAGVHVGPHSHPNEQIAWMLKGKMEFRLGAEQRVCGPGDVAVIPAGAEHTAELQRSFLRHPGLEHTAMFVWIAFD